MSGPGVKLWIGNLHRQVTEYQLLKICEKFGEVASFDFLYHITDSGHRTPRGYAFVTYADPKAAEMAVSHLHNKKVLDRELLVRYANPKSEAQVGINRSRPIPAALKVGGDKKSLSEKDKVDKIKALEAKLKSMESSSQEFKLQQSSKSSKNTKAKPYSRLQ